MIDYSWVPWFKELVTKIVEGGEEQLAQRAKDVEWGNAPSLLAYGDENIDPFSFLYFLAQKNTKHLYESVFGSVHQVFGIEAAFPNGPACIPRSPFNVLFHDGTNFYPQLLWHLFRQAAPTDRSPDIQAKDFNAVLNSPGVRTVNFVGIAKLTQALFIANPNYFLPADANIGTVLPQFRNPPRQVQNYERYVAMMDAIKRRFPGCEPYEINTFLDTQAGDPLITPNSSFFQVGTNVFDDGTDYWEENDEIEDHSPFKENNHVYTGGPGKGIHYPLTDPKRGDIVLVRTGVHQGSAQGRAIGVVEKNGYDLRGWINDAVISVHWINKTTAFVAGNLPMHGFSNAGNPTISAFRNTDAYRVSFNWLMRNGVELPPESSVEVHDTPFPLNTILFGPPGTGKTWEAVSYAVAILIGEAPSKLVQTEDRKDVKARFEEFREEGRIEFVTFHQSYTYEDFVEGIGPVLGTDDLRYELRDGVFKRIASRAGDDPNQRYVLIIDEINRGNIAKIFGELITLIEPSKRSGAGDAAVATLPYSQEPFEVPGNLYLVGTMNTADRGIALLDTALRRRFVFLEKMPDMDHVEEDIEGVNGRAMLKAMNERITVYLDREHQIGHTYLIGVKTVDGLAEIFQYRILPLLQEYFYDDWAKIRSVLNGNPFIRKREIGASIQDAPERPVFELLPQNHDDWMDAASYRRIYTSGQDENREG